MSPKDKKRTNNPIKLIVIFFVWILSFYMALILLRNCDSSLKSPESSRPIISKAENICKSPECITLAHQLHNWQDISVDPCQDFYKAACGKYNEHTVVNATRLHKKTYVIIELIREFLEKNLPTTSKSENTMKLYYEKCKESKKMKTDVLRNETLKEMLQAIQSFGSWPILDEEWDDSEFDLNENLLNMAKFGVIDYGFFSFKMINSVILVSTETLKTPFRKDLEQILFDMLEVNGVDVDEELVKKQIAEVLEIKEKMAEIHTTGTYGRTFSNLRNVVPSVNFEQLIKNLWNPNRTDEMWQKVTRKILPLKNQLFSNSSENLDSFLKTTSKRTLANFLILSFINNTEIDQVFDQDCAMLIISSFPLATLRVFVRNHFDKENLEIASEIVEQMKETLIEVMKDTTWLHEKTKKNAIEKIKKIKKVIGYPKEFEEPGALDKHFESINLNWTDSIFEIKKKVNRFATEKYLDHLADVLTMEPSPDFLEANAMYIRPSNELWINAAYLDDPILDSTYPSYAQLASIGKLLGHEIGHGFDPLGRKYDENGNWRNWWTREDSAEYDKRSQCFVEKYTNFDDPSFGKVLNGTVTIREITADTIGIDVLWKTFKKLDVSNERKIIGFEDYHLDKLFFRLVALNWCAPREMTPLAEQLTRSHPTFNFRVNGIFSNMKPFADAYNCPVGSPMNPEKKCELF